MLGILRGMNLACTCEQACASQRAREMSDRERDGGISYLAALTGWDRTVGLRAVLVGGRKGLLEPEEEMAD